AAGRPAVTEKLLIREGEAGRHEHVVLARVAAPPSSELAPPEAPSAGLGTRKVVGITMAGAGLAGVGVGAVFGLMAISAWSSAKDACGGDASHCRGDVSKGRSYNDTTNTDGLISTVGFIAGGALLAAGGVVFFTGGGHDEAQSARLVVAPRLGPGQLGLALSGAF
ncbi:MAG: hypothetical protein M3O50_00260, partial [Myxococcota bacterium]|nr:hypothetical protein [Myxococcota bacterium]